MHRQNPFDHIAHDLRRFDACKACAWDVWQKNPPAAYVTSDAYADDPCCPVCCFTGLICDTPKTEGTSAITVDVICDLCGARWTEQYALRGYTNFQPPAPSEDERRVLLAALLDARGLGGILTDKPGLSDALLAAYCEEIDVAWHNDRVHWRQP